MHIRDIYIEEFGAVNDKCISLQPGFNLIVGENESGKSTLCAFIRFIFYGFADAHERDKYSSFMTKNSAGYLVIENDNGKLFRIERRDNPAERTRSRVTVFGETGSDGEAGIFGVFEEWRNEAETPGDYFLGVSHKLYGRSVYVSQETGAVLDGGSAEAVGNLLLSGSESANLRRAKNTLDALRKEFRLKRGRGGLIPETEDELQNLHEEFRLAQNARTSVEGLNIEIKQLASEKELRQNELEEMKAAYYKKRASVIRKLQCDQNVAKAGMELNRRRKAELLQKEAERGISGDSGTGFIPDEAFVAKAEGLQREISAGEESYALLEKNLGVQDTATENRPKGYDKFCEMGTAKIISETQKHSSILNILKFALLIALTISGAGLIAFLTSFAGFPASKSATLTVFIIFLLIAGTVFYIRKRYASEVKELWDALGADETRTPETVCRECEEYRSESGQASEGVRKAFDDARQALENKKAALSDMLKRAGKSSVFELHEAYNALLELTSGIDREYAELETRFKEYGIRLDAFPEKERMGAAGYTETELREAEAAEEITEEQILSAELSVKRAQDAFTNAKLRRAEIVGSSERNLAGLAAQIEEAEERLQEYNLKHDAAVLAYDMLSEAETSIRLTVSPYLARYAGEYFGRLTEGRYRALSLDSEMNLRYRVRGNDSEEESSITDSGEISVDSRYLSMGSADLAWLCLRLALHRKLSENKSIPIILDECLVYFDDRRLERILDELQRISESGVQILLLSASSRERELIHKFANVIELE